MTKEEIIRTEYEAIKRFAQGDKDLAYRVVFKLSPFLRDYIDICAPRPVTVDELCKVIQKSAHRLH